MLPRCYLGTGGFTASMDKKFKFDDKVIKAIPLPLVGQQDYRDLHKQPRGFGLRVSATGVKSFTFTYRAQDPKTKRSKLHRIVVGRYPETTLKTAREKAEELRGQVSKGTDPLLERRIKHQAELDKDSFGVLARLYLNEYAMKNKRSWREDQRIIDKLLLPTLEDYKAHLITRKDIKKLLREIADRAPIMANRTLSLLRKIFYYALDEEIVDSNPCSRLPLPGGEELERERALSATELGIVIEGLTYISSPANDYIRLLILLGQRPGETLKMEFSEIDIADGWWTIPGLKTKNKLAHRVPLPSSALAILQRRKSESNGSRFVFPGRDSSAALCDVKRPFEELKKLTTLDFRLHDLRRTTSSFLTSMGVARFTVKRLLNHKDSEITAIYDRYSYDKEKREALELWNHHLNRVYSFASNVSSPLSAGEYCRLQ